MERVTKKRWRISERSDVPVEGIDPIIARLLAARGIEDAAAMRRFLAPSLADIRDPFLMKGMAEGAARIAAAIRKGERICIHGDYDADGITATALLVSFFRTCGGDCIFYIPDRMEEGYGLGEQGLVQAAAAGAAVMVTVDCGITAVAEGALARQLGLDLIITDHHMPGDVLPDAVAVINPHQPGCTYPFRQLAGVGVAFLLAAAVRRLLREGQWFTTVPEPNLADFLDYVALGTVADVVPLVEENRIMVRHGLKRLTEGGRAGIDALKKVSAVVGEVTSGDVGFRLAPRLNASGRLDHAVASVDLLLATDTQKAEALAEQLDAGNRERRLVQEEIFQDALRRVSEAQHLKGRNAIVLAAEGWHPGVIGIVASKLVELYHRPTILIAMGEEAGKGSGRSIPAFHLYDALCRCSRSLQRFGGHHHAAGLSVAPETLEQFVADFLDAADLLAPDDLVPELMVDAELAPDDITLALLAALGRMEPFGAGNPEPVFVVRGMPVLDSRILKEQHLKLRVGSPRRAFDAIAFNSPDPPATPVVDIAFSPQINRWNGRESIQLRIRDLQPGRPLR